MSKPEDLTGRKFGRLTAIKIVPEKSKGDGAYWECLCDCGKTVTVIASSLKRGNTRSCGCLHQEQLENQWSDNHGELIRCKDCVHWEGSYCYRQWVSQGGNWFCANGERKQKDG
jgi:hypothetical protein